MFSMNIQRGDDGIWHVDWTPDAEVGDVIFALSVAMCGVATSMSTDPGDILQRVATLIDSPHVHIRETWRPW